MSYFIPSASVVALYTLSIGINCIISPFLLISRIHFIHAKLRLFINGILGLTFNVIIPLVELLPRMYGKKFAPIAVASQLRNSPTWLTEIILYFRCYSTTSLLSFIAKIFVGIMNYWTLRLLAESVQEIPRNNGFGIIMVGQVSPSKFPTRVHLGKKTRSRMKTLAQLPKFSNYNTISFIGRVIC
ncbi:hypothetical protein THRCLA_20444, partial [Thraustotheca clavata]